MTSKIHHAYVYYTCTGGYVVLQYHHNETKLTINKRPVHDTHSPGGGQSGAVAPPWNLKMLVSYAASVQNILKFLLAPSALASNTLKLSLRRRKIAKIFVRAFVIFVSLRGFAPSGKFLRAPMMIPLAGAK